MPAALRARAHSHTQFIASSRGWVRFVPVHLIHSRWFRNRQPIGCAQSELVPEFERRSGKKCKTKFESKTKSAIESGKFQAQAQDGVSSVSERLLRGQLKCNNLSLCRPVEVRREI